MGLQELTDIGNENSLDWLNSRLDTIEEKKIKDHCGKQYGISSEN